MKIVDANRGLSEIYNRLSFGVFNRCSLVDLDLKTGLRISDLLNGFLYIFPVVTNT